jgi:PPK2 family polyphosphate:nucleotide phosphotransferase
MKLDCRWQDFQVRSGPVKLGRWPTSLAPLYHSKAHYRELLDEARAELQERQNVLYAHGRYALLLVFQGMDAAGKDGAIRHVMSGVNPQGCRVFSFQQPSAEELAHDFLWRTHQRLPERGQIGIFNRSYYEEVLIARVRPEVLAGQRLPEECLRVKGFWRDRFRDIVRHEDYLHRNGTRILKFFLHLSREEQRQRLLARVDDPDKNWKLSPADLEVRRQWDAFQMAYADCLEATSTKRAPWFIIPADDKKNARLLISQIILATLRALPIHYPRATAAHLKELKAVKRALENEAPGR